MRKVLLADDEPFILQGLKAVVDWNAEGFEVVKTDVSPILGGDGNREFLLYLKPEITQLYKGENK